VNTVDLLNGRLKLRHLMLVVAVAEHGSLLHAAEHLRLAQPAATRTLREVEAILGVELFTRGPRGSTPTLFGDAFLDHARAVLAELRRAAERISGLVDGETGTVRVGTLLAGASVLLPRAIVGLKRGRPGITVVVSEAPFDAHVPKLLDGEIDLILGRLNPIQPDSGLRQVRLYDEPIRLTARRGHPAHIQPGLRLVDLIGFPWVFPLERTSLRSELEALFAAQGLPRPGNLVECTSIATVGALLRETDMIAAIPELVTRNDPDLAALPMPLPSIDRSVGLTMPARRAPTPATQFMIEQFVAQAASLA
jgi:DNA-binding transcriptional LysR family regulator